MRSFLALALVLAAGLGCSKPYHPTVPDDVTPRLGDAWFEARAAELGISVEKARARDEALSEEAPPKGVWDAQTAKEAAAIWASICAECHGRNGDLEGVQEAPVMPKRKWGTFGARMGFLFGGDKMRAGIFRTIAHGGPQHDGKPSPMQAFYPMLAKEQIWALVFYIEGF